MNLVQSNFCIKSIYSINLCLLEMKPTTWHCRHHALPVNFQEKKTSLALRHLRSPDQTPNWVSDISPVCFISSSLHWPADDQVSLVGSVGQSHAWLWKPSGWVNTDVSPLVWSHGVDHIEHHLRDANKKKDNQAHRKPSRQNLLKQAASKWPKRYVTQIRIYFKNKAFSYSNRCFATVRLL